MLIIAAPLFYSLFYSFVPTTKEIKASKFNAVQSNPNLTSLKQRVRTEGTAWIFLLALPGECCLQEICYHTGHMYCSIKGGRIRWTGDFVSHQLLWEAITSITYLWHHPQRLICLQLTNSPLHSTMEVNKPSKTSRLWKLMNSWETVSTILRRKTS